VKTYLEQGNAFLFQAFNNPTYLEDITGLTQMKLEADAISIEWEAVLGEDDDF
jgi:hypothetical protein